MTDDTTPSLLTADDESRLARAIEAGLLAGEALSRGTWPAGATASDLITLEAEGRAAWQRFLLANVRLVWMVARYEARRTGLNVDELFQEGFVALSQALQRFDHTRGRFTTFALPRVRQHLAEASARRFGELPLPPSRAIQMRRALALAATLSQEQGRSVGIAELSTALGRSQEWTSRLVGYQPPVSLFDETGALRALAAEGTPEPGDGPDVETIRSAVVALPADQREVVMLRFGFTTGSPEPYPAVARHLKVSLSTVRRLERRALAALRCDPGVCSDAPGAAVAS